MIPQEIKDTAFDLEADALVTLYEVELTNGVVLRLCPQRPVIWKGNEYDALPAHMADIEIDAQGKLNRPKFSFANPEGIFSFPINNGFLDNAIISRIQILKEDLEANRDIAIQHRLRVSRVVSMMQEVVVVELRDVLDGHQFEIPARRYLPPEFPHVKL